MTIMTVIRDGKVTPEYEALMRRVDALKAERGETKPFVIGQSYKTNAGATVTCVALNESGETAQFSDGAPTWVSTGGYFTRRGEWRQQKWHRTSSGWRYNRPADRGRVTGTAFDHSHPDCVIPESINALPSQG